MSLSIFQSIPRGWQFLKRHRTELVQAAMLPAFLWLSLKSLPLDGTLDAITAATGLLLPSTDLLANLVLAVFALNWFRFAVGRNTRPKAATWSGFVPFTGMVLGTALRAGLIVAGASVALVLPTIVIALALMASGMVAVVADAVSVAFPLALVALSPLLIRFYAYYAALAAGRHDVRLRDAWRWMRGRSLGLLMLVGGVLAPAFAGLGVVEGLNLGLIGYGLVMPLVFAAVALATTATARAMGGLIAPPVLSAT
ncbi:MAG: hypothetical protein WEB93_04425 [Sphingomonadales bacterium]